MVGEPNRSSIRIDASPEEIFDYFTDSAALVQWMGSRAALDPRTGGEFSVDIDGVPVRGVYLEIDRPRRVVISWGHLGSTLLPPGASHVEVLLEADERGTIVTVVHSDLPDELTSKNATGWMRFLVVLARLIVRSPTIPARTGPET